MAACNSLKFLVFIVWLHFLQILAVDAIREGYVHLIPAVFSGFVASDQQHGAPFWVEGIEDAIRSSRMLDAQLSQRIVAALDAGAIGEG
jgi:hypothetical protein